MRRTVWNPEECRTNIGVGEEAPSERSYLRQDGLKGGGTVMSARDSRRVRDAFAKGNFVENVYNSVCLGTEGSITPI